MPKLTSQCLSICSMRRETLKGGCLQMQAWEKWLRATTGKLRVDCLARRVCGAADEYATLAAVNEACAPGAGLLSHLFSIYIHPSPQHKGYPKGSIFHDRDISPRVNVEWGSWGIVEVRQQP